MTRLEQRGGGAMDYAANRRRDFSRDGPLPNHVTNTPAEPHLVDQI